MFLKFLVIEDLELDLNTDSTNLLCECKRRIIKNFKKFLLGDLPKISRSLNLQDVFTESPRQIVINDLYLHISRHNFFHWPQKCPGSSVVDPHYIDADPDSTYHPDADPDPTFHPDADPDTDTSLKKSSNP